MQIKHQQLPDDLCSNLVDEHLYWAAITEITTHLDSSFTGQDVLFALGILFFLSYSEAKRYPVVTLEICLQTTRKLIPCLLNIFEKRFIYSFNIYEDTLSSNTAELGIKSHYRWL